MVNYGQLNYSVKGQGVEGTIPSVCVCVCVCVCLSLSTIMYFTYNKFYSDEK